MDKQTRNLIQKATQDARNLLESEFGEQLEGVFDILLPNGHIASSPGDHLDPQERIIREKIVTAIEHEKAGGVSDREAVVNYLREASFTYLNRFAALKMLEARGLVQECLSEIEQSSGFKEFCGLAPGLAELPDKGYRLYIESLFDELSTEIRVLFDGRDLASLLWPGRKAFEGLLDILNREEISGIWGEDETIGWVYQYFNRGEERKKMREVSQAPRNSRELAVRNQFFTPRYVVEFLTDNTLGRIWYEMRKGGTALNEDCRYLVRRPNEIFLAPGEKAPAGAEDETNLTQKDLLKQPVYIGYRPKKDPRDLRVLDPACGSGHFLLYAFDLIERIYEEAWEDPESPESEITGGTLRDEFETLEELRGAVPKLIIEYNLHGIDIDPRAAQIAALSLWLRAQKTWKNFGIKAADRPQVAKSNIVTAEPMPGEEDIRREFTASLKPRVLGQLVDIVFDKMKLAGEAGFLLKIEKEIENAVAKARKEWQKGPKLEQKLLFPDIADPRPKQQELRFDFEGVNDERYWEQAEDRILDTLKDYAERSENGHTIRRRLFAEDAARGFAFIELCRKHYDVVLMNPPFGRATNSIFDSLKDKYPDAYVDIYCCFIQSGINIVKDGFIGAITSRSYIAAMTLDRFRGLLIPKLRLLADLGIGVLDSAMVEACAVVLTSKTSKELIAFDIKNFGEKKNHLYSHIKEINNLNPISNAYIKSNNYFLSLPKKQILYSAIHDSDGIYDTLEPSVAIVRTGLNTFDNFRFLRCYWEISADKIGQEVQWHPFGKGGEYETYYDNTHLIINRKSEGEELAEVNRIHNGQTAQSRQSSKHYYRPGLTYSIRSLRGFNVRHLPAGCVFSVKGPVVFSKPPVSLYTLLSFLNTESVRAIVHNRSNWNQFMPGILKTLSWRQLKKGTSSGLESIGKIILGLKREIYSTIETSWVFTGLLPKAKPQRISLADINLYNQQLISDINQRIVSLASEATLIINGVYGFDEINYENISHEDHKLSISDEITDTKKNTTALLSYCIGAIWGRWDVRIALEPSLEPKLPDPFDRFPVCPPGMLIGPDGLPAESGRIVTDEWLRNRPNANTLPPEAAVKNPTVPDNGYPLRIFWDGILVDDPGFNGGHPHHEDIIRRTREVLNVLWKDEAQVIEQEACDILGIPNLRTYFRKSFFPDHIKRYSKSRRKAPIYWQLSTPSASYSIWLYYHRFTKDTFYKVLNEYVTSKRQFEERELTSARQQYGTSPTASQRKEIAARETFVAELKAFKDEVARIAPLWNPNLNDGVIINFAPLWRLVPQNRSWQKECKKIWDKLIKGDYDWAHLAMYLWPERVVPKCTMDRSLAIAHELEEALWEKDEKGKWHPKDTSRETLESLIQERTSITVKAALEDLLNVPVPTGTTRKRRKRKT